ncbi:MAG: cysteine--tRNA ligase [Deltaproteobacteria bacterium]|jgi:cysteinyl-tRNA synthetase|nr:cysteine--tRNA ligase [Deltaproteobacteria bacterium]
MALKLYNTLSRSITQFNPIKEKHAGLYVCGPTVYDHAHIGHARSAVAFDILVRHLEATGHKVTYVRNYTDIDDKIIARAKEQGVTWEELANKYILSFAEDMEALNCLTPTYMPRATEYIKEMQQDVQGILDKGYAYVADGDVYFDVESIKCYGKLSHRELDESEPGARVAVDERKKNPADFALWKASKPGEPSWESPWGPGRPGWHIECSTMSARLLGPSFDIHGGGQDLVFPHHENEIAQSAALGRTMANIWAHNGFVNINNEKMSKSLGNFFNIKDIIKLWPAEVLRFFLLASHYRSPIDYSEDALNESRKALERIYRTVEAGRAYLQGKGQETGSEGEVAADFRNKFNCAMDDDLNTSQALGYLFDVVHLINREISEDNKSQVSELYSLLLYMGSVFGLKLDRPEVFFSDLDKVKFGSVETGLSKELIEEKIESRNKARESKNWAEADRIRDELTALGVILEDRGGKTTWRFS